jgi:hypothetical protein
LWFTLSRFGSISSCNQTLTLGNEESWSLSRIYYELVGSGDNRSFRLCK